MLSSSVWAVAPGGGDRFWIVDATTTGPAEQAYQFDRAAPAYPCVLLPGTPSVLVTVAVWSGPPPGVTPRGSPFYVPSGTAALEASGVRIGDPIPLGEPGLYWALTTNSVQASGGDPFTYRPRAEDPYDVKIWRVPNQTPPGTALFPGVQPWDADAGTVRVSHSQFWVHCGDWWQSDETPVTPDGDMPRARDGAVAIPTVAQNTRAGVVLSLWEQEPPLAATGRLLGECRLQAEDRELAVHGGVNGPGDAVLVLPETGEYAIAVWRRMEPGEVFEYERYDARVWHCPPGQ